MARRERRLHLHAHKVFEADDRGGCAARRTDGVYHFSGIDLTVTRKGIEVGGWYDSFVGIEGGSLTWEELDRLRAEVNRVQARAAT